MVAKRIYTMLTIQVGLVPILSIILPYTLAPSISPKPKATMVIMEC